MTLNLVDARSSDRMLFSAISFVRRRLRCPVRMPFMALAFIGATVALPPGRAQLTSTWIGSALTGTGNWSNDLLWLIPPQPGYHVVIDNLVLFPAAVNLDVNATINQLSLGTGATLTISNGHALQLNQSSVINGSLFLNSATAASELVLGNGTLTLSGSGTITMSANAANRIRGASSTDGLINQVTIQGGGAIGAGFLSITNHGTILANEAAVPLVISPGPTGLTNTGKLRATNGATLSLWSALINNAGGTIMADADSHIDVTSSTISGGVLSSVGTGHFHAVNSTFSGVTISGGSTIEVANGDTLTLAGNILNDGLISLLSTGTTTGLTIDSAVSLAGSGSISLSDSPANRIAGGKTDVSLVIGANQTITGAGQLGADALALTNLGTVIGSRSNALVIDSSGSSFTNSGTLRATGSGGIVLTDASVTNLGTIDIAAGSLVNATGNVTQSGTASAIKLAGGTFTASSFALQGGSLVGSGTIQGPVTASGDGIVSPGGPGTIGALMFTSTLNLGRTTGLYFDLGGLAPGIGHDRIDGTSVTLDGSLFLSFIQGFEASVTNADTLTLLSTTAALNGTFAALPNGSRVTTLDGLGSFQVNYSTNALTLSNFQAVPEPSTYVLLTVGAFGVWLAERRRRRRRVDR